MSELDFRIGAEVLCEGQSCGRVAKLVVDAHSHRVTDVIVRRGFLFKRDTVVPMDVVGEATQEQVQLALPGDQLGHLPAYREQEYATPPQDWEQADYQREHLVHRVTPRGAPASAPLLARVRYHVHEGISSDETVVRRGMDISGLDGKIGTLDHVLIDNPSGDTKMLVVARGLFGGQVVIPANLIVRVTEEGIAVNLRTEQLDTLHHYRRRSTEDTLAEVGYWLQHVPVKPDSIQMDLEGGVVRLSGCVPDERTRRHIEDMVRTVDGVLDVDNQMVVG